MKSIMRTNVQRNISLFAHVKHTVKIYVHNFTHLLKISINNCQFLYIHINNHLLLYIHINTNNNYHKKYSQRHPKYFTMIPKKIVFCIYKNGSRINQDGSYNIVDLYLNNNIFFGIKILTIIMIVMLIKYYYLKKVIMNILLDIMI